MKSKMFRVFALMLCTAMFLSLFAQAAAATTQPPKKQEEDDLSWKVTGKYTMAPPFTMYVNENPYQFDKSSDSITVMEQYEFTLTGQYPDRGLAGKWDFNFTCKYSFMGVTAGEGIGAVVNTGYVCVASGKGEVTGPDVNENNKAKKLCKEWKPRKMVNGRPVPIDPKTGKPTPEPAKAKYTADFPLGGQMETFFGTWIEDHEGARNVPFPLNDTSTNTVVFVKLDIFAIKDDNRKDIDGVFSVEATFTVDGKNYGPYTGYLNCNREFDGSLKGSGKIPIWGVWNERNPYDPMPNLEKDYGEVQEAIKKSDTPKKIDYVKGNWVSLKQAKTVKVISPLDPLQFDPTPYHTYQILSVGEDGIYYEKGELWPTFGERFVLHPAESAIYSLDLKERKACLPWASELDVIYSKNNDTLSTNIYDSALYRVRPAQIAGVWSTVKTQPDDKDDPYARILNGKYTTPGTWYVFSRKEMSSGNGSDDKESESVDYSDVYYSVTRTTVNSDGSARIDTGMAEITPFFDNDQVDFFDIKTQEIEADGTKKEPYASEDEIFYIRNYDKDKGTMDIGTTTFYKLSKATIKGNFSTNRDIREIPNLSDKLDEAPQAELDKALALAPGTHIFSFDSDTKKFTWIQRIDAPEGVLVQTGKYSTVGDALLILDGIKGGFISAPGETEEEFNGRDYSGGEKVFQFVPTKNGDGNIISVKLVDIGILYCLE